jgi:hypothetical protein
VAVARRPPGTARLLPRHNKKRLPPSSSASPTRPFPKSQTRSCLLCLPAGSLFTAASREARRRRLSSTKPNYHGAARQEGGGADGAARAGDHALRQQLRLPGQPGHQEPLPELLPGSLVHSAHLRAAAGGVPAEASCCDCSSSLSSAGLCCCGRWPAGSRAEDVAVVGQPVPQLPEARGAHGVPLPVRRAVLRRAPVLGPARVQLRLQVRRKGRHRQGESRRARGEDR